MLGFGLGLGLGLGFGLAPVRRRVAAARGQLGERRGEGARLAAADGHAVARVGWAVPQRGGAAREEQPCERARLGAEI